MSSLVLNRTLINFNLAKNIITKRAFFLSMAPFFYAINLFTDEALPDAVGTILTIIFVLLLIKHFLKFTVRYQTSLLKKGKK